MRKILIATTAAALAVGTAPAHAQLGGLTKLVGGGSGGSISAGDVDGFVSGVMESTKLVWVSATLLEAASKNKDELDKAKAAAKAISDMSDVKELEANKGQLKSSLKAIDDNQAFVDNVQATYESASPEQKELIAAAVFNFALGMARNVELADDAPRLLSGIKGDVSLLKKAGSLKTAAELTGLQVKGASSVVTTLPKLMAVAKVEQPEAAMTTKPQPITF